MQTIKIQNIVYFFSKIIFSKINIIQQLKATIFKHKIKICKVKKARNQQPISRENKENSLGSTKGGKKGPSP